MPHNNRAQKLDANSKPVDQYFNNTTDQYEVQTGSNGAKNVSLVGSTIPQGQEIPMKILGCNTSQDYLVGAVVTAGTSTPILENVDIDGNEIGVGVRLSAARKYKVSIVPKTMSGLNTDNDAFIIDKSTSALDRGSGRVKLTSRKNNIYFMNMDTVDITLSALNITTFRT